MKYSTWKHLEKLRDELDIKAGKRVQQFLALAFLRIGAVNLTNNCVQGIDIEFELDECEWAIEVKMVISDDRNAVSLGDKDLGGLLGRTERGRRSLVAVLGNQLTDEWLFILHPGSGLKPKDRTPMPLFRPFQLRDLTERIQGPIEEGDDDNLGPVGPTGSTGPMGLAEHFEQIVEENIQIALKEDGETELNKVLKKEGAQVS